MNRRRFIIGALIAVVALAVTYWLAKVAHPFGLQAWMIREQSLRVFVWSVRDLFRYSVLTPAFLIFIALTLTLQRLFPAKPNQALVQMVYPFRQTQEQYAASPSIRQRAPDRASREA